jgi:hypothetical protein
VFLLCTYAFFVPKLETLHLICVFFFLFLCLCNDFFFKLLIFLFCSNYVVCIILFYFCSIQLLIQGIGKIIKQKQQHTVELGKTLIIPCNIFMDARYHHVNITNDKITTVPLRSFHTTRCEIFNFGRFSFSH